MGTGGCRQQRGVVGGRRCRREERRRAAGERMRQAACQSAASSHRTLEISGRRTRTEMLRRSRVSVCEKDKKEARRRWVIRPSTEGGGGPGRRARAR